MSMIYFYVVGIWALSGSDEVKSAPGPDVPANLGYLSIFMCLLLLVTVVVVFCINHIGGKKPTVTAGLIYGSVIVACFVGMSVGYDYHVKFLHDWYASH